MKWQLFENKISKELSNHTSDVDIQNLWESLEPEVDAINNQRKKRRGFIWFFLGGLLLIAAGGAFLFLPNEVSESEEISEVVTLKSDFPEVKEEDVQSKELTGEEAVSRLKSNDYGKVSERVTQQATTNSILFSSPKKTHLDKGLDKSKLVLLTSKKDRFEEKLTEKKAENSTIDLSVNDPQLEEAKTIDLVVKNEKTTEQIEEKRDDVKKENEEVNTPDIIEENMVSETNDLIETTTELGEDKVEKETKRSPFKFAFATQTSISFTDRVLEEKTDTFSNLRALRDVSERMLETTQFGLRFSVGHQSGFELTSGVNCTQINELFRYNESVISQDSVDGIQFFVRTLENELDTIYGKVPVTRTTTLNKKYYNKYRMIEVPILLGWSTKIRKVRVGAQAGIFANISTTTSGRVLKNATEDTDVETDEIYKTNVGLSYYFGISAGYALSNNFEIYASPFARIFSESFTKENYGLTQKYRLYGINVGARWTF